MLSAVTGPCCASEHDHSRETPAPKIAARLRRVHFEQFPVRVGLNGRGSGVGDQVRGHGRRATPASTACCDDKHTFQDRCDFRAGILSSDSAWISLRTEDKVIIMMDTDRRGTDRGAAGGGVGHDAGDVSRVLPRKAPASAPTVVAKSPVHAACSRSRAGRRLTGNSQTSPSVGGGRRAGRARLGEPDGLVWSRLAQRDRTVLALVAEHQVLTTWQLLALVFPSAARAQRRLR